MRNEVNSSGMVNSVKYSMAFTTCSLLVQESIKVAQLFVEKEDWKEVSQEATKTNLLQYRTESSLKRTLSEIISRLKLLPSDALPLLANGFIQEQLQILWFAVCLRYPFIKEFATEVIKEKYIIMQPELTSLDYDSFFNSKINWHVELETITDTTKNKLKQVLFKMLKESEIVDDNNYINTVLLSPSVKDIIAGYNKEYLNIFPN